MSGVWVQIGLVLVLVVINALFAGSEIAVISLREGQLRQLEQRGVQGRLAAKLARDPNQLLSTVQIGITLAGFLASAAAAVSLAQPLVGPLGFLGTAAKPTAIVLVTIAIALVMAPAALHRQTEPLAVSRRFIRISSRLLMGSMAPLAVGICLDIYVVARVIVGTRGVAATVAASLPVT